MGWNCFQRIALLSPYLLHLLPRHRDTYPLVVRQLQQLGTVVPSSLTEREVRRVTALLAVVEAGIHIGGITKATLRMNGSGGMTASRLPPLHCELFTSTHCL